MIHSFSQIRKHELKKLGDTHETDGRDRFVAGRRIFLSPITFPHREKIIFAENNIEVPSIVSLVRRLLVSYISPQVHCELIRSSPYFIRTYSPLP